MEFCADCGGKLKTTIKDSEPHLKCGSCGEITKPVSKENSIKKVFLDQTNQDEIRISIDYGEKVQALGDIVRHECKNCPSTEAYFAEIKPNRFNDEQSIVLYRCVRCTKVERAKTSG